MRLPTIKPLARDSLIVLAMLFAASGAFAQLNADFSMDKSGGCSPLVINFTNRSSGASANAVYSWTFGNGNTSALPNPSAIYTDEQTYTVTLTVQDGGNQSSSTQQLSVYKAPTVNFTVAPAKICLSSPVTFTSSSDPGSGSISGYAWDFGDGSTLQGYSGTQSYTYNIEQTATVSLTVTNSYGCHTTLKKQDLVKIIPTLNAGFTADKKVLCLVSDPVQFTNTSSGPGTLDYKWDFADGNSSTQPNPQHIFSKKGIYSIQLTVHSSEGCTSVSTQSNSLNVASYSSDFDVPNPICNGSNVVFNNLSSPVPDNSVWLVDGSQQYSYGSLYYNFTNSGTHTITLNNTFGTCPQSASKQISVKDIPMPNGFTANIAGKCGAPVLVNFKDPTATDLKWQWDFNYLYYNSPQVGATTQATSHTYTSNGTYLVWLMVTNAAGCSNTTTQYVQIAAPTVYISAGAGTLSSCNTLLTNTFTTNASEPLVSTNWNFGDGATSTAASPTHTFKNSGNYNVSLSYTTQNGCKGIVSIIQFSLPYPAPVSVSAGPGNLASCITAITTNFIINSSDPLISIVWNFGDGTASTDPAPTHTYAAIGHYAAALSYTTQSGCKGVAYSPLIIVDPKIKTNFTPVYNPVCGGSTEIFNASTNVSDINSYNWDFGDGATFGSSSGSATHAYSAPGDYVVTLYARNIGGCDTTMTKKITVNPPFPIITGHSAPTCDGTRGAITFTQASIQATTLVWNFGDGTTQTTPGDQGSVTHVYTKTGIYSASLTAKNGQCSLTAADPNPIYILLKQQPLLSGSVNALCGTDPLTIQITRLDKNPYQTNDIYSYNYYSGYFLQEVRYRDGNLFAGNRTDSSAHWITSYRGKLTNFQSGEKDLRVILTSAIYGCQDTTNFIPLAVKGAVGGFKVTSDKVCYQLPVVFQDTSSSTSNNPILSRFWNFGDGQTATKTKGGTVTHIYASPGSYAVSMQITDASGCSSGTPSTQYVSVYGPQASFAPSGTDVHLNTTVYFYNTTNDYGNNNTVYSWNFGDGTTSTDFSPYHTYAVAGSYHVTMTASNPSLPCSSVAKAVDIIVRNFNSAFSFNSTYVAGSCPPVLVSFSNTSYNYIRVTWDFGDGITADNVNYPSHIYEKPGKYIVTLHVYAYNGIEGIYIDSIFVEQPTATLSASPLETCIGSNVSLSAAAQNTTSYFWDFGDGSIVSSTTSQSVHQYLTAGVYKTTLLMQDANGCSADAKAASPVTIRPDPVIALTPDKASVCKGTGVALDASGGNTYSWKPSAGLNNASISNPYALPDASTTYTITVADDIGCSNSSSIRITVVQPGSLTLTPDTAICLGKTVQLQAAGEENYSWINTTTGLSSTTIPNPVAIPEQTTTYTLTASQAEACFPVTADMTVTVWPLPTANAGPDAVVWAGETTVLSGTGSNDVTRWNWTPASYLNCSDCPSPVCAPLASITYTLTSTNQYGCEAIDEVNVKVDCEAARVAIPNAFTPNGDGINDVFAIRGISVVKHLVIYGRWGEKVFERNNFVAGDRSSWWNGTSKGLDVPAGTYVYFVEMECPTGGAFTRKGSVVLIR